MQQLVFCFSTWKNCNVGETVAGVLVADILVANILVADKWKVSVNET